MPRNNKSRGTAREHAVKRKLEADGWVVFRAPASLGAADLVALRRGVIRMIEVKSNMGSPYMNFRKAARARLVAIARQAGGYAELAHWPPRGACQFIGEELWPRL